MKVLRTKGLEWAYEKEWHRINVNKIDYYPTVINPDNYLRGFDKR